MAEVLIIAFSRDGNKQLSTNKSQVCLFLPTSIAINLIYNSLGLAMANYEQFLILLSTYLYCHLSHSRDYKGLGPKLLQKKSSCLHFINSFDVCCKSKTIWLFFWKKNGIGWKVC